MQLDACLTKDSREFCLLIDGLKCCTHMLTIGQKCFNSFDASRHSNISVLKSSYYDVTHVRSLDCET